uniref:Ubiquitin-conjugating enzyme E2 O n=1 Tax=Ascaris suum TaxID=6253 RepID=F1KQX0_ASCSU
MNVDDFTTTVSNRVQQDDTVVYLSKGAKAKLGVVTRIYRGIVEENEKADQKLKQGEVLIDVFPGSVGSIVRKENEVFIADRGFSLSESVVKVDCPKQIGFIRNIHVKADVIVLPERKIVAQNVDLTSAKFVEPFASGGPNYLLFDDWIGSALKSVFELTIVFRNSYRCKIKDNVGSGVLYRRKDYGIGRQWVPGETVMVSTAYVTSKKVEWESEMPSCLLKRKMRGSFTHHTPFTIEKVSLYAVKVRWLTTPSASVTPPPERITKPDVDRIIKLDTLEYTQAVCGDRMKLKPDDSVTVVRKAEWEKVLAKELMEKLPDEAFKGRRRRAKKSSSSSSSSSCSASTHASTYSTPAKKRMPSSAHESTHVQGTTAYPVLSESDSESEEELMRVEENVEELVDDEETLAMLRNLRKACAEKEANAAKQGGHNAQTKSEGAEEQKTTDTEVTTTQKAFPVTARLSVAKKSKSATFNIRQIRRNKQNRAMKRKAGRTRMPLDVHSCLGDEFYGDVMRTHSTVDVIWMNGIIERDIPGTQLVPYELDLDHHDDVPGTIVARKICEQMEGEYGIVLSADTEKRLATVQWYLYDWNKQGSEPVLTQTELCSLFELMLHPNYQRFYWGSLCLRTSKESSDVRNLIGQLISTNENGKNTVAWFNGTTEDVWPVEITVLLTNDEMDGQFDEEDEDDTWNSVDIDDDLTEEANEESPIDASGISLLVTERGASADADPAMSARIVLPQELIQPRIGEISHIQSKISEYAIRWPSKSWTKNVQGRFVNLSEIVTILKQSISDYDDGKLEYDEALGHLKFMLVCLNRSTRASRFPLVDFVFAYADLLEKDMERLEYEDDIFKRCVHACYDYVLHVFEKMIATKDCSVYFDQDAKCSPTISEEENATPGTLFLELFFGDWIDKLRDIFHKVVETPSNFEDFIESPFFTTTALPNWFPVDTRRSSLITEEKGSAENNDKRSANANSNEHSAASAEGDEGKLENRKAAAQGDSSTDEMDDEEAPSPEEEKSMECHLEVDSFDFMDLLMPQFESFWAALGRDSIKRALQQFIGKIVSNGPGEHGMETATIAMEIDPVGTRDHSAAQRDTLEECEEGRQLPKLSEASERNEKMALSIAAALSTFIYTLLYDVMCNGAEIRLFNSYGLVESSFRMVFYYYYDGIDKQRLAKEKGKERICWDDVMECVIEKWYDASVEFTELIRGRLKEHFAQLLGRLKKVHDESVNNRLSAESSSEKMETDNTTKNEENDPQKPTQVAGEEESEQGAESQTPAVAAEDRDHQNRRFPAVEFDSEAPVSHAFHSKATCGTRSFMRAVRSELQLLSKHLPDGIYAKAFENRLDLLSSVIVGPKGTPFEDVPFFFDVHLPSTYPAEPPLVHYWAFSQEQLNPNLYQGGKVCVSLLGTWNGKGSEQWTSESNLLQVLLSIQGLILVPEPYFNEAGYESRKNVAVAVERSRRYNEMALVNSLDYFYRIMRNPPKGFEKLIKEHCHRVLPMIKERISAWESGSAEPDFPLCPISEGCKLSLRKTAVILGTMQEESAQNSNEGGHTVDTETASSST